MWRADLQTLPNPGEEWVTFQFAKTLVSSANSTWRVTHGGHSWSGNGLRDVFINPIGNVNRCLSFGPCSISPPTEWFLNQNTHFVLSQLSSFFNHNSFIPPTAKQVFWEPLSPFRSRSTSSQSRSLLNPLSTMTYKNTSPVKQTHPRFRYACTRNTHTHTHMPALIWSPHQFPKVGAVTVPTDGEDGNSEALRTLKWFSQRRKV